MQIDWAVFGERNRGHALLACSGNSSLAARITQYTDRPGDPPVGLDWGPVDSGFHFAEHYILLRTLPDPTAGRAGMVLSFAAYVPDNALASLGSLAAVFRQLPNALVKLEPSLSPLDIADVVIGAHPDTEIRGLISIARQLGSPDPTLPLVWASAEPYLPIVDALWGRLPVTLRPAFAFAFQFAPEHNLPVPPVLVATLPELSGRWSPGQLITVEASHPGDLNAAQRWFAGMADTAEFDRLLDDYGIVVREFRELNLLSVFADLIARLPDLSFAEASKAVRIVEKYSKEKTATADRRSELFARLCALVSAGTPEEIARLRNLDEEALDDLIEPLQMAIKNWLSMVPLSEKVVTNLEIAASDSTAWWSKPFIAWLKSVATLSSAEKARIVCELLASEKISKVIKGSLSQDADTEEKLLAGLPKKLDREHAEKLQQLAQNRGWMRLHAACLLRSRSESEAISTHAEVAGGTVAGLQWLHGQLGFQSLLQAACSTGNAGLVQYVGAALPENHDISATALAKCKHWCSILAHSINQSTGRLEDPLRSFVVSTTEAPGVTAPGFARLWTACTDRDAGVWLELVQPDLAIAQLPPAAKTEATAKINAHIETEIKALRSIKFTNPDAFREIVDVESLLLVLLSLPPVEAAKAGVNAFKSISFLSDENFCRWLIDLFTRTHYLKVPAEDARAISSVLMAADYPKAAEIVRQTAQDYFRADIVPVFEEIRYKYHLAKQHQAKPPAKSARLPKVVIATALPLERHEVIKWLGVTEYDATLCADVGTWPADQPLFEVWHVTTGAGNLEAQGAILPAVRQLKPKLAFFVGVGGGLKDSEVGDAIYSTKVYYYEGGKEDDNEIKSRPITEHTSKHLVQLAMRVADQQWQPSEAFGAITTPKATPAIIASGEKILASLSSTAATVQRLKLAYNDAQIIDMEAYGFLKACRAENVPHSMVIRGVSDKLADKAKSDAKGNQPLAARNAAAFLFALLRSSPAILKPTRRKRILGIF